MKRRFREIQGRALWACQRAFGTFYLPAPVTGATAKVASDSTTVLVNPTLASTYIGYEIYFGGLGPYFTITDVATTHVPGYNTQLTLDRVYGGASATAVDYSIEKILLTPPSDFLAWIDVVDTTNEWRLWLDVPRALLDRRDPTRSASGTPRLLSNATYSAAGIPRYELWERAGVEAQLQYVYYKAWEFDSDSDAVPTPFSSSAIVEGALADLCRWPGVEDRKNPCYDMRAAQEHETRMKELYHNQMREDQEIYQTDISYREWRMAPIDARWLQRHDPESYEAWGS